MSKFDVTTFGYKSEIVGGIKTIEVVRKKSTAGTIGKVAGMMFGFMGVLFGAALCVTIIGIPLGFPIMVLSLGIVASAQGFQHVKCAHCGKKLKVLKTAENVTCTKCRQLTVINWI